MRVSRSAKTRGYCAITIDAFGEARRHFLVRCDIDVPSSKPKPMPIRTRRSNQAAWRRCSAAATRAAIVLSALAAAPARASFLSGEALDTAADVITWIVLIFVPVVAIVVFWLVHVLPERYAEKRHHPQVAAIQTLCLLSLVFGGLLWPFAWLWAFTKPVGYKAAYGTDKHESYFDEMGEKVRGGQLVGDDIEHLRSELDAMAQKGALPPALKRLRAELGQLAATGTAEAVSYTHLTLPTN